MANKLETFNAPSIEMPDKYKKHVEGEETMSPDELRDKNISPEENFGMPPRIDGERQDFTEEVFTKDELIDQKLINAIDEINNPEQETTKKISVLENNKDFQFTSPKNISNKTEVKNKSDYRLAMLSYENISKMMMEYQRSKNTALEDEIREAIAKTRENFETINDKKVDIQLGQLRNWEESLPKKLNEIS